MTEQREEGSWGWGSWGFAALADLHKAAEGISKNAVEAAKGAAKGMADLQSTLAESLTDKAEETSAKDAQGADEDSPSDKLRRDALKRLEGASRDSSIGHGLKVLDSSMENLASEAYQALGNAWKGGMSFVHRIESSAEVFAGSVHSEGLSAKASALAPKLIQSGRELTAKSLKALEFVGKETLDILALDGVGDQAENRQNAAEDASFDHCFYIYGGPEHLEELEALSSHYALVCNRAKSKMSTEERAAFDELCKQVPRVLSLGDGGDCSADGDKGKKIGAESLLDGSEVKSLREAGVSKAAEMATSFTTTLEGLAVSEVIQKTWDRIEAIKAEGVHRLSELCAVCMSHLVLLSRSLREGNSEESGAKESDGREFEWPKDCLSKALVVRSRALNMVTDMEAISDSFVTGIGDVVAAFQAAKKKVIEEQAPASARYQSIEDKARALCCDLQSDGSAAVGKLQHGLEQLMFVLVSTAVRN
ncbi:hypothetical protein SELMODRAFT_267015 [Selaginella moellendorffii]|uniref:DUF7798 domain-containing protein n=1 Tax=Selaginella moellendorffii TaxID=88036 RepID=D8R695_SELML|nr:uncharacterized protein LOC9652375 [Selaginella moellendorffii]EFJ32629.1 hypothetical protein SELMODRAFT_267015 [Selaginella moellendorffii]|eukprot:XP_002966602.1 uncharacterized protein LOC9652375 [Selaginella moellendorffii]